MSWDSPFESKGLYKNFVAIYILQDTYRTKSNFSYSAHLAGKHPIFRKENNKQTLDYKSLSHKA